MATTNLEYIENQKNEYSYNKLYNKSLRSHLAPNGTLIYSNKPEPIKNPSLGLLKLNNKNKDIMIDTRSVSYHNKINFPKAHSVKNKTNYFNKSNINDNNNFFDDDEGLFKNKFDTTLDTIPKFPLNYHHLPQSKVGRSIYETLTVKKNEFLDIVNRQKEIDKLNKPNLLKRQEIMENIEFSNFFHRKKNLDDIIQNNSIKYPKFSTLNSHLSTSLKERYFSIMKNLYFLNDFIEKHPDNEEQILKEFLINHGIFDMEYYSIEKLNNFSKFLKLDFTIDLNLNFKENLINILNGKFKLNSNKKKNLLNKSTNIKYYYKTFNNKKPIKKIGKLRTNLEYQKKMNESNLNNNELDLINKPKEIIDLIENEFNQELERRKNIYRKNLKSFRTNINFKNEKLYGKKKSDYDYNELKKQNKLTEYICLTKAKNNYELEELKKKYNYNI